MMLRFRNGQLLAALTLIGIYSNFGHPQNLIAQSERSHQLLVNQKSTLNWPVPKDWPNGASQFTIQKDNRTLGRGNAKRVDEADEAVLSIDVMIESDSMAAIIDADIRFQCKDETFESRLQLFPANPFANRTKYLDSANVQLFDTAGDTAAIFDEHKIPFKRLREIEDAEATDSSLLVIGEQCDRYNDDGFAEKLMESASLGQAVLCLRPKKLELKLNCEFNRLILENDAVPVAFGSQLIGTLEPSAQWQPKREGDSVSFLETDNGAGWSWIEVHPVATGSNARPLRTIVVCGLPVIEKHDEVPAARHLLWQLIEHQINSKVYERESHETIR